MGSMGEGRVNGLQVYSEIVYSLIQVAKEHVIPSSAV